MWCFVNHTRKHIVSTELYDVGRQLQALISYSDWRLIDDIDIENLERRGGKYPDYSWDV